MTKHEELVTALCGDDPEMMESIQPLGWLYTVIQELKDPKGLLASYEADPDAWWMMIQEVETMYERASRALGRQSSIQTISDPADDYADRAEWQARRS